MHGEGVHAIAQAGGRGAVVEDVAEVAVAEAAADGGADHAMRVPSVVLTMFSSAMGAVKLGQPVPDSNLVSLVKSARSQPTAAEEAGAVLVPGVAGEGALGGFVAEDPIGIRRRSFFHSASERMRRGMVRVPVRLPWASKSTMVTVAGPSWGCRGVAAATVERRRAQKAAALKAAAAVKMKARRDLFSESGGVVNIATSALWMGRGGEKLQG